MWEEGRLAGNPHAFSEANRGKNKPMSPALQVNTVDPLGELKKPLATAPHVRLRCVPMCVCAVLASAGSVAVVC